MSANSNTITVTTDTCPLPVTCGIITDSRDGKTYKTIIIGTQCWMAQNLNVGIAIPGEVAQTPGTDNKNADIEKYCYNYRLSSGDSGTCATYGGLYLWDEMMAYGPSVNSDPGPQGICPTGWHLPTEDEWSTLVDALGTATAGGKLKDTATHLWKSPNKDATNESGFTALPGGLHNPTGTFGYVGEIAYFWAATEGDATAAWTHGLSYNNAQVGRYNNSKALNGVSVRCVKD